MTLVGVASGDRVGAMLRGPGPLPLLRLAVRNPDVAGSQSDTRVEAFGSQGPA